MITLATTPLQAAGEELWFRGAALPAAASWGRAVRPALFVGVVVSALAFTAVHARATRGGSGTSSCSASARA